MGKIYCLKCNFANEHGPVKPNFCGKCGKPFIDSAAATITKPTFTPTISRNRHQEPPEDDIEYPEDAISVPNIDKIEFNLGLSNFRPNRESGKDVFNSGSPSEAHEVLSKKPVKGNKNSKVNKKQIQQEIAEQFKSQLGRKQGNGRPSTEIGG